MKIEAKKKRVISGMRPTGKLHIGHYFGALQNWVRLQNDPAYDCFYFIADWHALTSDYADTSAVALNTIEIVTDYLAAGLDPQKSVLFQQSLVPEHAELHLLLSMVTPLGWLERVPTYKEALENIKDKDLHNYGFLGYPVLQCSDITMYSSPDISALLVPVGEDQVSHVETSREIVRRFDAIYARIDWAGLSESEARAFAVQLSLLLVRASEPSVPPEVLELKHEHEIAKMSLEQVRQLVDLDLVRLPVDHRNSLLTNLKIPMVRALVEPGHMLTTTPRISGLDGRKMSKSYGNTIMLSESDADIRAKTKVMVTDPARKRRTDPGNPDVCPVYDWHKLFSSPDTLKWAAEGCRTAGIGCIECKAKMADHLIEWITPVRERRVEYERHPKRVLEVIDDGSKRARGEALKTMVRVREAVFGWEKKRAEIASS